MSDECALMSFNWKPTPENWALGLTLLATLFTGMLGVFKTALTELYGVNSFEVTFIKFTLAAIVVGIALFIYDRDSLKLRKWTDLWFIILFSFVNIGFTIAIFLAMETNLGVALSAALQSTNAYFTLILAAIFFKEKITVRKVAAICVGFIGCLFVVNIVTGNLTVDPLGIFLSILSAIGVSVFWLGTKYAGTQGYSPGGTLFWFCLVSAILALLLPQTRIDVIINTVTGGAWTWFCIIGIGIIATMIPKFMIIQSFQLADAGKVSVVLAFDMVTSAIYGAAFLGESITVFSFIGIFLIIFSISMIELKYFDKWFGDNEHGGGPPAENKESG